MVSIASLWLPILVSAVGVFILSSLIHMVLGYHQHDLRKLPKEDEIMAALRPFNIPPGDYGIPCAESMEGFKSPEFREKMKTGPVAFMTVIRAGDYSMGSSMVLWFIYSLVVGVFAAYLSGVALPAGAGFKAILRFAGCTAFLGYGLALAQVSIWYRKSWRTTLLTWFDALLYGILTGAVFGWLWPH